MSYPNPSLFLSPVRSIPCIRSPLFSPASASSYLVADPPADPSHLQPITWEEFLKFDPPSNCAFKYEIVEELVVHVPIRNYEHDNLRGYISGFLDNVGHDELIKYSMKSFMECTVQTVPISSVINLHSSGAELSSVHKHIHVPLLSLNYVVDR